MMKKALLCISALVLLLPAALGQEKTISVADQKGFDRIQADIVAAATQGVKDIKVDLKEGEYVFRENHIVLSNRAWPELSISLEGNGSIIRPEGSDYRNGGSYAGGFDRCHSFMTPEGEDVELFEHFKYSDSKVSLVRKLPEGSLCRIAVSGYGNMDEKRCANTFIQISQTWQSNFFPVKEIRDGYAYFVVKDLTVNESKKDYYINDDVTCFGERIRYKLCNAAGVSDSFRILDGRVRLPASVASVREGKANCFLLVSGCKLKAFSMKGFKFHGNADKEAFLVRIVKSDLQAADISACEFRGIQSRAVGIFGNTGVTVRGNVFLDCYRECVVANENSVDASITDNRFCRVGKRWQNTQAIQAFGKDYLIARNVIEDFGTYGIGVGEWQGAAGEDSSYGVTEYNELFFSEGYQKDCLNRTLMDSGAIYVWTKNKHAVIRYNRIHDFTGPMDNRGIFCDNGARNFSIYGNIITGIANSYCIDSWRYAGNEKDIGPTNVNNEIRDNVVDGPIRFMARAKDSGCKLGRTYVCGNAAVAGLGNVISELPSHGAFVQLSGTETPDGGLVLDRASYRRLRRGNPEFGRIKDRIKRK